MLTLRINREERQVLAGEAWQVWGEAQSEAGGHLKWGWSGGVLVMEL